MTHPMEPTDAYAASIYDGRTIKDAIKKAFTDGADAELAAVYEWFLDFYKEGLWVSSDSKRLLEARRPVPPSPKEQALEALDLLVRFNGDKKAESIIRNALELLPDH